MCLEKSDCIVKIEFVMLCTSHSRLYPLSSTIYFYIYLSLRAIRLYFFLLNFRKRFIFLVHCSIVIAKWMWMAVFHSAITYRYGILLLLLCCRIDPYLWTKLLLSQEEHKLRSNFCLQYSVRVREKMSTNTIRTYQWEIHQKIHQKQ